MIPSFDLSEQNAKLRAEVLDAIGAVVDAGAFILGPRVRDVEAQVAARCGTRHGIGVANGTDALHLALRALDIGPGDEVITTAFTFVATTEAIGIVGATPVFVDIDPVTFNLDPGAVEAAITDRTKAILPVHLYGHPCDMGPLLAVARVHDLAVVEDAAQAIGARYDGKPAGAIGDIGCFSFFPTKNLGCFGDGGMAVTDDDELAGRIEMLRRHGGRVKYHHSELGLNSRLDELQAAVLLVKLPYLDGWIESRRRLAHRYTELLGGVEGVTPPAEVGPVHAVYHQYTVRVPRRDDVQRHLQEAGVGSAVYYPVPLHLQEVHADLGYKPGDLPHTEQAAAECLSLPMFPELDDDRQDRVVGALAKALDALR